MITQLVRPLCYSDLSAEPDLLRGASGGIQVLAKTNLDSQNAKKKAFTVCSLI